MIYEKKQTLRVVRTAHHVRIYAGAGTAGMMKRSLAQVPDGAYLTEITEGEGESNLTTLVFMEEQDLPEAA